MASNQQNWTIISSTYRIPNNTILVVNKYAELCEQQGINVNILDFTELPKDIFYNNEIFGKDGEKVDKIVQKYIGSVNKIVFVMPEYNGSYPGALKSFIDIIKPEVWKNKKASLIGVSSGRAGNLRGMDHFTHILHYLDVNVLPHKVPISSVHKLIEDKLFLTDADTIKVLDAQIAKFKAY
jgi:NAD(P)H-dependent FMN reductase